MLFYSLLHGRWLKMKMISLLQCFLMSRSVLEQIKGKSLKKKKHPFSPVLTKDISRPSLNAPSKEVTGTKSPLVEHQCLGSFVCLGPSTEKLPYLLEVCALATGL